MAFEAVIAFWILGALGVGAAAWARGRRFRQAVGLGILLTPPLAWTAYVFLGPTAEQRRREAARPLSWLEREERDFGI